MDNENNHAGFTCLKCGTCCKWPGNVLLTHEDITAMAVKLHMSEDAFIQQFTTLTTNRSQLTLVEQPGGACCFLTEGNTCRLYNARPQQCRDFPALWSVEGCPAMESISANSNTSSIREKII